MTLMSKRRRDRRNMRPTTQRVDAEAARMRYQPHNDIVSEAEGSVWIRTAAVGDVDKLCAYFATLSRSSNYNRFMGTVANFSKIAFDCLMQIRRAECFTLVAEQREQGFDVIIGEASYAFDGAKGGGEFAVSVADHWRGRGLGPALLSALQMRAISLGHLDLYGETLRTNQEMKSLARKAGFSFTRATDWRAVRFDKRLAG
jgi:GNAT superfamily N-acetyltransferase